MLIPMPTSPADPETDYILSLISGINGCGNYRTEIRPGVYEVWHFGSSHFLRDFEHYPALGEVSEFNGHKFGSFNAYGVCDNVEQLLAACPELEADNGRSFIVTLTRICKADEPAEGGWRWHKWGPYIGTQNQQCEYIHDEPNIDEVFCFHIYEKKMA